MTNTKPEPVVYRPDSSRNQIKILQGHLERLGFASVGALIGIDAAVENGWLVVIKSAETHYVSMGWEERLALLKQGCSQQDLWDAIGDASAQIDEMKKDILEAVHEVRGNPCRVRVNPFSVEVDMPSPSQEEKSANSHTYCRWSVPKEWVRSFLPR